MLYYVTMKEGMPNHTRRVVEQYFALELLLKLFRFLYFLSTILYCTFPILQIMLMIQRIINGLSTLNSGWYVQHFGLVLKRYYKTLDLQLLRFICYLPITMSNMRQNLI